MLTKIKSKKNITANWLSLTFLLALLIAASISEFFQAPIDQTRDLNKYTYLFPKEDLETVKGLTIKNQLGSFVMSKEARYDDKGEATLEWKLTAPRNLLANISTVSNVFKALESIRVRKVYTKDAINLSNFSLNTPVISITLDHGNEKKSELSFGLVNPIDESTFISIKDQDAIYQVDTVKMPIESLDLSAFVDSSVFFQDHKSISRLRIYRGGPSGIPTLSIKKQNNIWRGKSGNELAHEPTRLFLEKLTSVKSQIILDQVSEKQQKRLDRYLSKPAFSIIIDTAAGKQVTYTASSLIPSMPGVKIEKWQTFIVKSSDREYPFILGRHSLNLFNIRESQIRKMSFKKMFY